MTKTRLDELLGNGEGLATEFKRCSGKVEHDVFESICAFLNRFGGDVLLGVEDDGTVVGIKGDPVALRNNIMNIANDGNVFDPVAYIAPEIVEYDGKTIISVHVPASGEIHAYKGVVYDRNGDADVRVRSTAAKGMMLLRKQGVFTEQRIYPYVTKADLNLADLKRLRIRAQNNSRDESRHPWMDMDDDQLLRSAKLVGTDRESGKSGFNLAAVMLLGTEDVIKDICPAYVTDAILRVKDIDRYDDRDVVGVNLIAAYDRLMDFARKHLPDPFFLEGDIRKSLREIIVREMVANTLIHREFTSSRPARFVIERSRMYVENACRASSGDALTPENFVPDPRNPIIANFFRVIGYADQLGSGVRNLFKYAKAYGGSDPKLKDGDMFRIEVSLKTLELAQIGTGVGQSNQSVKVGATMEKMSATREKTREETTATREKTREKIIAFLSDHPSATQDVIANSVGLSVKGVEWNIKALKDSGRIRRVGPDKGGHWEVVSQ